MGINYLKGVSQEYFECIGWDKSRAERIVSTALKRL